MNSCTFTILRYPAELIDVWTIGGGARVTVRPVLPQDSAMLNDMIERASRETRRNRFHVPINGLSPARLRQMTEIDYDTHLAFVLTVASQGGHCIVGEARYVIDDDSDRSSATFGLSIVDEWQRRGLGTRTMNLLISAARNAGIRWLHGDVLCGNVPMLKLMRRCAFSCTQSRHDERVINAEVLLAAELRQSPRQSKLRPGELLRWLTGERRVKSPAHD
jgi:RimJ/RimL family protein N-acetyltransferase